MTGLVRIHVTGRRAEVFAPSYATQLIRRSTKNSRWHGERHSWRVRSADLDRLADVLEKAGYHVRVIRPDALTPPVRLDRRHIRGPAWSIADLGGTS